MLLPVPDTVALWLGVWLLLPVPVGVKLGLAPALRVEAAEGDWEALRLLLLEEDAVAVPEPDGVQVLDPVGLVEPVGVCVAEGEALPERETVLLALALTPLDRIAVAEALTPGAREAAALPDWLLLGEGVPGGVPVPLSPPDREAAALADTVLLVGPVGVGVPVPVPLLPPV